MTDNYPTSINSAKKYQYKFWKNKPVLRFDKKSYESDYIENLSDRKTYESVNSLKLPTGTKWINVDMNDNIMMRLVVDFLDKHYTTDKTNSFKFEYTIDFIKWALGESGSLVAIISENNDVLYGTIGASIQTMTVFYRTEKFGIANFLCVHPDYRHKNVSCILIDEMTRRLHKNGINAGCFTTQKCVPSPTTVMRYYHRPLNYIKLHKSGFCDMIVEKKSDPEQMDDLLQKYQKKFNELSEMPSNYSEMTADNLSDVFKLYKSFTSRLNIHLKFATEHELGYFLLNKFVKSYVIRDKSNNIVDFVSYYTLQSTSLNNSDEEKINEGNLFLYTCNTYSGDSMITNILKIAKYNNVDVFNVFDTSVMSTVLLTKDTAIDYESDFEDNTKIYEHKFLKGSAKLYFNFFNWKCSEIKPTQILFPVF